VPEAGNPYTFEDVARFLCEGAQPNQKLAQHFRRWARPMEDFPQVPVRRPMTRKMVVEALKALDAAAITILASLTSQEMHFVMSPEFPLFDRPALIGLLSDLRMRCQVSITSPLLTSKGRVKSGPETYPGYGADPRLFCASAILLAWQVIHGKYPGARNPWASKAAEAPFHLVEPKRAPRRKMKGKAAKDRDPLSAWRSPFQEVRKQEPLFGGLHDIYVESIRSALSEGAPNAEDALL
jgi:hypothetical protein